MRKYILQECRDQIVLKDGINILSYYKYTYHSGDYFGSKHQVKDVHIIDQFGYRYFTSNI